MFARQTQTDAENFTVATRPGFAQGFDPAGSLRELIRAFCLKGMQFLPGL
jgi:hypothetical protein